MSSDTVGKNIVSFLARIFLSGALLWYLFSKIDFQKTADVLRTAQPGFLVYAGILFLAINGILLWRWGIFIKALEITSPLRDVVRYYLVGLFGNLFLPSAIGGDFIKIYGLCRDNSRKTRVIASVLLDRLSGFAAIVLVAVAAFIFGHRLLGDGALAIPIAGVAAVSAGCAFVLFNERMYSSGCRIFARLPKIRKALMDLHYDVALMKGRRREGLQAIGVSCLSQIVYALCWYFIARSLSQETSLVYFLIFVPLTCIAASFPSIGGLGVREIGAVYLFGKVGMASGVAVSISLINFLFMVAVGLMGGVIYVLTLFSGRLQYHSPDARIRPEQT
ncbi:MAG: flippase-like domain-containing protein [Candidatus Omnitrophica bacterium]|nr:flippase-like domain-containing protein [Candidatus Omnitrophota bacterium]